MSKSRKESGCDFGGRPRRHRRQPDRVQSRDVVISGRGCRQYLRFRAQFFLTQQFVSPSRVLRRERGFGFSGVINDVGSRKFLTASSMRAIIFSTQMERVLEYHYDGAH